MPPEVSGEFSWVPSSWGVALQCRALAVRARLDDSATAVARHCRGRACRVGGCCRGDRVIARQPRSSGASARHRRSCCDPPARWRCRGRHRRVRRGRPSAGDSGRRLRAHPDRDRTGRVVAASHAGWRGTAADVAGVTVRALASRYQVAPDTLSAAIGPSIGPCCYEVGEELLDAFTARGWSAADCDRWFIRREAKLFLDVWQANAEQLERAGIPADRIFVSRLCTACHRDWFDSYRREGAGTGRLAGYIRARSG